MTTSCYTRAYLDGYEEVFQPAVDVVDVGTPLGHVCQKLEQLKPCVLALRRVLYRRYLTNYPVADVSHEFRRMNILLQEIYARRLTEADCRIKCSVDAFELMNSLSHALW